MASAFDEIIRLHNKGAKVFFAHEHFGRPKIKVRYGFLNLRTKRFDVDRATMTAIKDKIISK